MKKFVMYTTNFSAKTNSWKAPVIGGAGVAGGYVLGKYGNQIINPHATMSATLGDMAKVEYQHPVLWGKGIRASITGDPMVTVKMINDISSNPTMENMGKVVDSSMIHHPRTGINMPPKFLTKVQDWYNKIFPHNQNNEIEHFNYGEFGKKLSKIVNIEGLPERTLNKIYRTAERFGFPIEEPARVPIQPTAEHISRANSYAAQVQKALSEMQTPMPTPQPPAPVTLEQTAQVSPSAANSINDNISLPDLGRRLGLDEQSISALNNPGVSEEYKSELLSNSLNNSTDPDLLNSVFTALGK